MRLSRVRNRDPPQVHDRRLVELPRYHARLTQRIARRLVPELRCQRPVEAERWSRVDGSADAISARQVEREVRLGKLGLRPELLLQRGDSVLDPHRFPSMSIFSPNS